MNNTDRPTRQLHLQLIIDDSFLMEDVEDILNCSFSINSLTPADKTEEEKMDTERAHSDTHHKDETTNQAEQSYVSTHTSMTITAPSPNSLNKNCFSSSHK